MQDRTRLQGVSEPLNPRAWQSFGEYTAAGQVMLTHLDGYAIVRARKGFTENPRLSARAAHGAAAYILSHVDVLEPRFKTTGFGIGARHTSRSRDNASVGDHLQSGYVCRGGVHVPWPKYRSPLM